MCFEVVFRSGRATVLYPPTEDVDHLLWSCNYTFLVWSYFFEMFGLALTRGCSSMVERSFFIRPFTLRVLFFFVLTSYSATLWGLWVEWSIIIFREVERSLEEVWSLVRFHVSFWAWMLKRFYNYSLGLILVDWSSFFSLAPFGLDCLFVFSFFLYSLIFHLS